MKQRFSQFLYNFRQRMSGFMYGRNGNDALNNFLLIVELVLFLLAVIIRGSVGAVLNVLVIVLLGIIYFRMLSRDRYKRQDENTRFLRIRQKLYSRRCVLCERWKQRKDYKFFSCPSCHAALRVPKGRGKIKIVCRKCGTSFMGRS